MSERSPRQLISFLVCASCLLGAGAFPVFADGGAVVPNGEVAAVLNTALQASGSASPSTPSETPQITRVVNAASFLPQISPGSLFTLFISGVQAPILNADSAPWPTGLGGLTVLVGGRKVPLTYVSGPQINAQIPFETPLGSASVTVTLNGSASAAANFTVLSAAPGIFMYGTNRAVVENNDYSLNKAINPAKGGSVVLVYFTGGGALDNPVATGAAAPLPPPLSKVLSASSAAIGGLNAPVHFLGLTPTYVGLLQANIQVPAGLTPGDHPVTLTIGGLTSNAPIMSTN